jgi:hypothetical protein
MPTNVRDQIEQITHTVLAQLQPVPWGGCRRHDHECCCHLSTGLCPSPATVLRPVLRSVMATRAESVGQGYWFDARFWLTIQQLLLAQPTTKLLPIWPSTTGSERSGGYSCRGTKRSFSLLLSFGWSKLGLWAVRLSLWGTMTPTLTRQALQFTFVIFLQIKSKTFTNKLSYTEITNGDNINGDRSASLVELGLNHIGSIPSSYCYCRASVIYIALRGTF